MKTILENGARPVLALGWPSILEATRLVDWARSFSSLTIRKRQIGRSQKALTRIAGCARSYALLELRGWKNVPQNLFIRYATAGAPRQLTPWTPASYLLRARLCSLPLPLIYASIQLQK